MVAPVSRRPLALSPSDENARNGVPRTSDIDHDDVASSLDDESVGVSDPFLDSLLPNAPLDRDNEDDNTELGSDENVELLKPRDLNETDDETNPLDVPIELHSEESPGGADSDEGEGPVIAEFEEFREIESEMSTDGAEDGPLEAPITLDDTALSNPFGSDSDGDDYSNEPVELYVDDAELAWAKERWTEVSLGQTFSARRHLALVGNVLCVAGDVTHLHDAKSFELIESLPFTQKTARILALDVEANSLIVLTTTGQLLSYTRAKPSEPLVAPTPLTQAMVSALWQLAPGVRTVLIRLESGQLLDFGPNGISPHPTTTDTSPLRLVALSEIGEPRVSLWRKTQGLELLTVAAGEQRRLRLPSMMLRAASDAHPILLGFNEAVLFGARDHGLWLWQTKHQEFVPVPGCRGITAITVGRLGTRPSAFVGLFSELEDRAEIAVIDLATGRAARIAELCVHSDCSGPEDDPPELARIDSLVWDQNNGKLWVAGSFGLTCFSQPVGAASS